MTGGDPHTAPGRKGGRSRRLLGCWDLMEHGSGRTVCDSQTRYERRRVGLVVDIAADPGAAGSVYDDAGLGWPLFAQPFRLTAGMNSAVIRVGRLHCWGLSKLDMTLVSPALPYCVPSSRALVPSSVWMAKIRTVRNRVPSLFNTVTSRADFGLASDRRSVHPARKVAVLGLETRSCW